MKKVLLVDDETRMLNLLELYLSPHGYKCIKKNSGDEAIGFLMNEHADLLILDVMMPGLDGWTTCAKVREFSSIPIIMLTARSGDEDMVKGLKNGADDYVTKPLNPDVLLARMEALFRRIVQGPENSIMNFKGLSLDESKVQATYLTHKVSLTPKEFSLLSLFLKYPDKVFSRDHLLQVLWSFKTEIDDRTIDSHIRNIREKLRQVGYPVDQHLKTVWGIGYKWSTEEFQ
ncbi:response regulator transcription factor [Peribacillus acanthi]|uniref:response regulator transcription factor n=1 Tax=Peribacillus acanthi TaxID=2171554 RepID=UPI000D3E7ECD|nr:response regulator transcription factor [Peribacillus acanthi]